MKGKIIGSVKQGYTLHVELDEISYAKITNTITNTDILLDDDSEVNLAGKNIAYVSSWDVIK